MKQANIWISLILCAGLVAGCGGSSYSGGGGNGGGGGGTPSVNISSGSDRTIVDANGTATLTANVSYVTGTPTYAWQLLDPGSPCAPQCGTLKGTMGQSVVYTAPSSLPSGTAQLNVTAQVTVTSGSTTVMGTFSLTVTPAISVTITNKLNPATVQAGSSAITFTGQVANDENNAGVSWALMTNGSACTAACGTLTTTTTSSATYTPPANAPSGGLSVTITATSKASMQDPNPASDSDTFTITPATNISITVTTAPPSYMVISTSANVVAHVANDSTNKGVDWTVTCPVIGANCGTITAHTASDAPASYMAPPAVPLFGAVTITATSTADPTKSTGSPVTITSLPSNNAALKGQYAFEFNGFINADPLRTPIVIAGYFIADGNGNITGGIEDVNRGALGDNAKVAIEVNPASTYNIQTNERGTLTIATSLGTASYDVALDSQGNGKFIETDSTFSGSGFFEKQDATVFTATTLNGTFALGLIGNSPLQGRGVLAGEFQADGSSTISSGGQFDTADTTGSGSSGTFSGGSFTVDTTGHGTIALNVTGGTTTLNFAIDIVSATKIYAVEMDPVNSEIRAGVIRKQNTPSGGFTTASLSGNSVFSATGDVQFTGNSVVIAGVLNVTTPGTASGVLDGNLEGTGTTAAGPLIMNSSFSMSYNVAPNGRCTASVSVGTTMIPVVFYLYDQNSGFLIEGPFAAAPFAFGGEIVPQTGSFTAGTPISLTAALATETAGDVSDESDVGIAVLDSSGNFSIQALDSIGLQVGSGQTVTGTYTLAANGRGATASIVSPFDGKTPLRLVFYMVSPTEFVLIATMDTPADVPPSGDTIPVLMHATK